MTKKKNKKLINVLQFAGFGFPALFIWMSVVIIPFIYGIWITFTDWNGLAMHINYVGLQNYIDVFKDATFVSSFVKTVIYAFFTVLASNIVGFALALAVTSGIKGQGLFRTGFFTPNIIGGIILGYIWNFIFSYVLTAVGKSMGVEWMSTSWLTHPTRALIALIIVSSWQMSGYLMVIYIAGLTNVPKELIEAARVDGCSRFKMMYLITLPSIKTTIVIMLILKIGGMMSIGFEQPQMLKNAMVNDVGDVISTFIYRYGIQNAKHSLSTAAGLLQSVINFVLVMSANAVSRKISDESIW